MSAGEADRPAKNDPRKQVEGSDGKRNDATMIPELEATSAGWSADTETETSDHGLHEGNGMRNDTEISKARAMEAGNGQSAMRRRNVDKGRGKRGRRRPWLLPSLRSL